MKIVLLILVIVDVLAIKALQCWSCENQPTNAACQQLGKLEYCFSNQEACENEVRRGKDGIRITKRCKQAHACGNNFDQNKRAAWNPSQCNTRVPSSVCKCCCSSDGCNAPALKCLEKETRVLQDPEPECLIFPSSQYGRMRCRPRQNERSLAAPLGTVCTFSCNPGYRLEGEDVSECVHMHGQSGTGAAFNYRPPECSRITGKVCSNVLPNPENGFKVCSKSNYLGSRCEFGCDYYHARVGALYSTCVEKDGYLIWDNLPPTCQRKVCSNVLPNPENGFKVCSEGNYLESRCEFGCDDYHTRVGALYSTCVEKDGYLKWDNLPPTCQPNRCGEQTLGHGAVTCDNPYLDATTTCSFQCIDPGYTLHPPAVTQNTCLNNTSWNVEAPCCTRECPSNKIDFVVVLDSSSSVGADNWKIMKRFVRAILGSFNLGPDRANLGVFRYNENVDTVTQILLNNFTENMEQLLEAFDKIPYDGSGTRTGLALAHARNEFFTEENGNRPDAPDLLLIITDGRAQDDVALMSNLLRRDGVIIYVLGIIPPEGELDFQQLREMAGDLDNLIIATGGFQDLNTMFSGTVNDQICGEPCTD